ncbi:MAG: Uma2 family endonuclease [Candidatus Tectomicrobia bacterium]|uniref:Uma2 family endonuclease n=1 Tax=Tectimicrobiota bacterium TaxID=2528274 RepID=A0A937W6R3_UNCTE|nr:Uma2 family endonuclease [Candidatus Tectomicrobia bacterium]
MATSVLNPVASAESSPIQDETLYEIVDGQRVEVPPMSAYATWLASRLHGLLWPYTEEHALGTAITEMLFILDPQRDLRRRPDVAFVSAARWPLHQTLPETGDWPVIPDLVVEVLSPNDVMKDVLAKLREYFRYGVQVAWMVSPEEQQVYVYTSPTQVRILAAGDTLTDDHLLPGFHLPLARLFQHAASTRTTTAS